MQLQLSLFQRSEIDLNKALALSFLRYVQRSGMDRLIQYLLDSDFFIAPASAAYHDSQPGGLCFHSLNVMLAFNEINQNMEKPIPRESVVICGLLHDLCKINAYEKTSKRYKSVAEFKGHATVSISRIQKYIKLTQEEDDIIRYHMGLFGIFSYKEHDTLSIHKAIMRTPHVQIFAALDMADSKRSKGESKSSLFDF